MNDFMGWRMHKGVQIAVVALSLVVASIVCTDRSQARYVEQEPASGAIDSLVGVRQAVVRLVSVGNFAPLEDGEANVQSSLATAFIYNSLGYAYTNHHAVAGAEEIQVYLDGEVDPRSAKVVWSSACDDLAIIDIEGNGFPYLEWYNDGVAVGEKIYAAGFPHGDPEYKLTEGIVVQINGEVVDPQSALDGVITHSAVIRPGNSGGPLVNADGKVVGVNFGGNLALKEFSAIPRAAVLAAQRELVSGNESMELGISGEAWMDEDVSGIWVIAVDEGSLADVVGLLPGDLIIDLDGERLAVDGSMRTYCDILERHSSSDTLPITVMRLDTDQILIGHINGRSLNPLFVDPSAPTPTPEVYNLVEQENQYMRGLLPEGWEIAVEDWLIDDELVGVIITAAPDVERVRAYWDEPGAMLFIPSFVVNGLELSDALDALEHSDECDYVERIDGDHTVDGIRYRDMIDAWENCGQATNMYAMASASVQNERFALAYFYITSEVDEAAFHEFRQSLHLHKQADAPEPIPTPEPIFSKVAVINVDALNVRQCAGLGCAVIGKVNQGQCFAVNLQQRVGGDTWVRIQDENGAAVGWIAGPPYSQLARSCPVDALPAESTPTPTATPTPTPEPIESSEACILFENWLGAEVTVTFTDQRSDWNTSFKIPGSEKHAECFAPSQYTYTLDAPPPWNSVNGELTLDEGQYIRFPIRAE